MTRIITRIENKYAIMLPNELVKLVDVFANAVVVPANPIEDQLYGLFDPVDDV